MSELPNIFENAKVGDSVFTLQSGWRFIQDIDFGYENNDPFPLLIGNEWYTMRGTIHSWDQCPSAWPEDKVPQYYLDMYPIPKTKVKKTIERWVLVNKDGDTDGKIYTETPDPYGDFKTPVLMSGEYEEEE